jgi:hypothetical protein
MLSGLMARNVALGAVLVGFLGLDLVACGAGAPPQAPASPGPQPVQAAPPPPADLSQVPAPPTLVVSGRLAKLSASLATVHGWTKLPMPQSEQVTELLTSEAVGPIVDLDQPIDFAVAVIGSGARMKDLSAISAAVKDPDKVKAALADRYKLVPGDNGALVIQGLGKPKAKDEDEDDDGDDDGKANGSEGESARTCELAPAFGDAPVRIVCGLTPKALTELAPWLTRTATHATSSTDLHVDVRMAPLKQTIAEQRRLLGMMLGGVMGGRMGLSGVRELALAFGNDMADLASDLDGASMDATLSDAGAQADLTFKLTGSTSALGRVMAAHADRTGPAPATFWQLPADADFAAFSRGIDEAELARGRDLVLQVVADSLSELGLKDADRKPVVDALGKLVSPSAMVYGSGVDASAVRAALAAQHAAGGKPDAERAEAKRQVVEALLGWRVMEVDEPSGRIAGALKELSAAVSRPSALAALRAHDKEMVPPSLRALPIAKAAGLPAGAQHYVLELHPGEQKMRGASRPTPGKADKKAAPPKPVQVHIFVVPDGQRTWIAVGGDEAVTSARLATTLASSGEKLASRAELAALKDARVGSGGFFTTRGLPEAAEQLSLLSNGATSGAANTFEEAAQMPHLGVAPVLFSATSQGGGSPAAVLTRLQVPRDAIEDVVTTILRHGGF